jgi:hypothetical protein
MPHACVRHPYWRLALIAVIALATPAPYTAAQDNPVVDSGGNSVCANLGRIHLRRRDRRV